MERLPRVPHPQNPLCAGTLCDFARCAGEPGLAPEGLDGFIPVIVSWESQGIHSELIGDAGEETFPLECFGSTEFQPESPGRRHNHSFHCLVRVVRRGPCRAGRGISISGTALELAAVRRGARPAVTALCRSPGRASEPTPLTRCGSPGARGSGGATSPLPGSHGVSVLCPCLPRWLRCQTLWDCSHPGGHQGDTSGLFPTEPLPWEGLSRSCFPAAGNGRRCRCLPSWNRLGAAGGSLL